MKIRLLQLILKIMKLSFYGFSLQLILLNVLLAGGAIGQKNQSVKEVFIDLQLNNASIIKAFNTIESKTNYRFNFNKPELDKRIQVNLYTENSSVAEVLMSISKQTGLKFRQVNETINVDKLIGTNDIGLEVFTTEDVEINGKITDENGQGLPGASVVVKGTSKGTTTDIEGNFNLITSDQAILAISFVGYITQEIAIGGRSTIDTQLVLDAEQLDEVVVVGYGSQKKRDLTGAVASIEEEGFTQGVNNSAVQLLNGRVSGVFVSQTSSAPGGNVNVRIRGAGSINSSNNVLIVVDGLPGASTEALSPNDIESIEVLKDASAAAIYGTRAANGVILITTKKGKAGATKISYESYFAHQNVSRQIEVLNATQYMQVLNDLQIAKGLAPKFTDSEMQAAGEGTNWQDEIFRTAWAKNHQLSISGGSNRSKYYVGLNYFDQEGIVKESNYKRYNLRFNNEFTPTDRLTINLNLNLARFSQNSILETNGVNELAGPINTAIQYAPTISSEPVNGFYQNHPTISLENPLAEIYGIDQTLIENRSYSTLKFDYKIFPDLTATVRVGADLRNSRFDSYNSRLTILGSGANGSASIRSDESNHYLAEFFATYNKDISKGHNLKFLVGTTFEEFDARFVTSSSQQFLSDVTSTNLLQSGDSDGSDNVSSGRNINRLNSFIGRLNYTLLDKYLLTFSVRADGTSRFAGGNKYAVFPSAALGWRISDEQFFSKGNIIDDLKLRVGYGQLGNQGINNFETISTYIASGNAVLGSRLIQGVAPARVPNSNLRWEVSEEVNFGIDFGILKGRLNGSFEYFIKDTKDQLLNRPIPSTSGFDNIRVNFGEVRNTGVEFLLESHNFTKDFTWSTTFTISTLKNRVTKLPEFTPEIIGGNIGTFTSNFVILREGETINSFYGYDVVGIFQEGDDIANSAQPTALPGHPIYRDTDQDGLITSDDRIVLGKPLPDFTYGVSNSFGYKNFSLDIFFIGVEGISTLDNNVLESFFPFNSDRNLISEHYLNRWTPENPDAVYPSGVNPSSYGGGRAVNSFTISDASFFRLKTVTLSYNFPVGNHKVLDKASMYVASDNLFTVTPFKGYDPDANNGSGLVKSAYNSYPLSRTIRVGVKIGF